MRHTSGRRRAGGRRPLLAPLALLLAPLLALLLAPRGAAGHAVMVDPQSRQWLDYLENYNFNPHGVNGGGAKKVGNNGALRWPARQLGTICGDAAGDKVKWDNPGRVTKTYKAGGTAAVDVVFAQNHLGRVQTRLCPLDAKDESQCQLLERANGRGTDFDIPWPKDDGGHWWGVTVGFVPPVNTDGFEAFKMPPVGKAQGCRDWSCDQFKDMWVYRLVYKIPLNAVCTRCKLQLSYLTGSSCWPACKGGSCGPKPVPYGYCGDAGTAYPETFWNCADVQVDRPPPPPPPPPPRPSPAPAPAAQQKQQQPQPQQQAQQQQQQQQQQAQQQQSRLPPPVPRTQPSAPPAAAQAASAPAAAAASAPAPSTPAPQAKAAAPTPSPSAPVPSSPAPAPSSPVPAQASAPAPPPSSPAPAAATPSTPPPSSPSTAAPAPAPSSPPPATNQPPTAG